MMGFSKKEIREEKERILKKGGTFLIKGIWEYKGELILYGKVEKQPAHSRVFKHESSRQKTFLLTDLWGCEGVPVIYLIGSSVRNSR